MKREVQVHWMPTVLTLALSGLLWICGGCDDGLCPSAVGSGSIVTQSRVVGDFNAITISIPAQVIVDESGPPSLKICAEDNIIGEIRSEVRHGRLRLFFAEGVSVSPTRPIVIHATSGGIRDLVGSGAADLELQGTDTEYLAVCVSGASTLEYFGNPRVTQSVSGASFLRRVGP